MPIAVVVMGFRLSDVCWTSRRTFRASYILVVAKHGADLLYHILVGCLSPVARNAACIVEQRSRFGGFARFFKTGVRILNLGLGKNSKSGVSGRALAHALVVLHNAWPTGHETSHNG